MTQSEYFKKTSDEKEKWKRLNILDAKLSESLNLVESFDLKINALEKSFDDFGFIFNEHLEQFKEVSQNLEKIALVSHAPKPEVNLSPISDKIYGLSLKILRLNEEFNVLTTQIKEIKRQQLNDTTKADLSSLRSSVESMQRELNSKVEDISYLKISNELFQSNINSKMRSLFDDHNTLSSDVLSVRDFNQNLKEIVNSLKDDLMDEINEKAKFLNVSIDNRIEEYLSEENQKRKSI